MRFRDPARHFFSPHLSPKLPHVGPYWAMKREGVGLIDRAWSTNVTDRETDGGHAISIPRYAL